MTTPLSLGFASAYQKIEDSLPHTHYGVSPILRTGINDLATGGETPFSQLYAEEQMRRYMGKVKSEGLANSQYLLGIHPNRRTAPATYVAPIFGEGQAHGLHGGMIDKQTQPMLAKIWANKAKQIQALASPEEVGAPAFLPSESEVTFNSEIRDEKQNQMYKELVNNFDLVGAIFETGDIVGNKLLLNLTTIFNLLKEIGWTMNQFEVNEFIDYTKNWLKQSFWEDLLASINIESGMFAGLSPARNEREAMADVNRQQRTLNRAKLIYQYISAILDILFFIRDQVQAKVEPNIIKQTIKPKIAQIRKTLSKGKYMTPEDLFPTMEQFETNAFEPFVGSEESTVIEPPRNPRPRGFTPALTPRNTRESRMSGTPSSRGLSGVSTPSSVMSELISRPSTLTTRSGLETPLSSVGAMEARRVARDMNELINGRVRR